MINLLKKKYIVVFLNKEQESFNIIGKKIIKANTTIVKYSKDDTTPIDISKPTYSKGLKLFYFVNLSTNLQLQFIKGKNDNINSKVIDMILNQNIIKQLTSNLADKSTIKANIINLLIGGLIGGLITFIVSSYLFKYGASM